MAGELEGAEVAQRMVEVHAALGAATDLDAIMQAIVVALAPWSPDSVDFSRMHTGAGGEPEEIEVVRVCQAGAVQTAHPMYGRRFSVHDSPFGRAMLRDPTQAVYVADTAANPETAAELAGLPRTIRAVAVLPLYSRRHRAWQGVIVAQWATPHAPGAAERLLHALLLHATAEAMAGEQVRRRNEALLHEVQGALHESRRQQQLLAVLFEHLPVGVAVVRGDTGALELINPAGRAALGLAADAPDAAPQQVYRPGDPEPLPEAERPEFRALRTGSCVRDEFEVARGDGTRAVFDVVAAPLQVDADAARRAIVLFSDITTVRQAERARITAQTELLRMQAAALAERSTPLIPIRDDVLVLPLIGAIDPERGRQILETLTGFGGRTRVRAVIVDLTGVRTVDTAAAGAILEATRAVRLRGVRPLLTGIQPAMAATLVELGVDFGALEVFGSLQDAVERATRDQA